MRSLRIVRRGVLTLTIAALLAGQSAGAASSQVLLKDNFKTGFDLAPRGHYSVLGRLPQMMVS
jgi:hypothetical protein